MNLWQQARISKLDDMVGNADALAALRAITSGFVLISGQIGCGKTSVALAWARERFTKVPLEESTSFYCPGAYAVAHMHADEFSINDAILRRRFFDRETPTILLVDEAHLLTEKKQQSKLKTIPTRADLTLCLITSEPQEIEESIRDRCAKIRLGPLSARELRPLVERACSLRGMQYDPAIVPALNRGGIFRPRAVLNVVDSISRGVPLEQA